MIVHVPVIVVALLTVLRFGKSFESTLLYQSIAVILCQLAMLHLCIKVRNARLPQMAQHLSRFTDYRWDQFWTWSDFESYVQLLLLVATVLFALNTVLGGNPVYVESLGGLALGVESTLALPQAYKNHVNRSTTGLK